MKTNYNVVVDIDDCLNNLNELALALVNEDLGTNFKYEDIVSWSFITDLYKDHPDPLWAYKDIRVLNNLDRRVGSYTGLKRINKNNNLIICSACSPKSVWNSDQFVLKNFDFIKNNQIVFARNKHLLKADLRIDDACFNLSSSQDILFKRPWSLDGLDKAVTICDDWSSVIETLESRMII